MASSPAASFTPEPPALALFVDGRPAGRVEAPSTIAPRAWILGVVAVQLRFTDGALDARLRVHTTGAAAPTLTPLHPGSLVQVALTDDRAPPLPAVAPPVRGDAAARLVLFLGSHLRDQSSAIESATGTEAATPRAFGHVFCRWLRDGGFEAGFDLTDFVALAPGQMYPRRVSAALAVGQIVSFAVVG